MHVDASACGSVILGPPYPSPSPSDTAPSSAPPPSVPDDISVQGIKEVMGNMSNNGFGAIFLTENK